MGIKDAVQNIKEAKFRPESVEEMKSLDAIYGPINALCPICGIRIRNSCGYVCTNCNWEIGSISANPVSKSTYKLLFKLLRRA